MMQQLSRGKLFNISKPYHRVLGNEMVYVRDEVLDLGFHFRSLRRCQERSESGLRSTVCGLLRISFDLAGMFAICEARLLRNSKYYAQKAGRNDAKTSCRQSQREIHHPFSARIREG